MMYFNNEIPPFAGLALKEMTITITANNNNLIDEDEEDELEINDVIFSNPATIVFWSDDSKTIVKAQNNEPFDKEKGLAMAIIKRMTGNTGGYNEIFKEWCTNAE